jgi:4-hydroxy-2-oxoglutarate aldolase
MIYMHLSLLILFLIQVTRELGVPAMKEAMDMMGLYGGPCRRPLQPLTDSERQRVRDAFSKNGFYPKY